MELQHQYFGKTENFLNREHSKTGKCMLGKRRYRHFRYFLSSTKEIFKNFKQKWQKK